MRIRGLSYKKPIALAAIVLGLVGGSYGVASAATTSSTTGSSTVATATASAPTAAPSGAPKAAPGATAANPWGNQRSDETLLTGDTLAQVKAAVTAKVGSDVTIVRIETDADGNAAYEAHLTTSSGTAETVYVDKSFNVVSVETR
jgi:hypothetical protein